MKENHDWKLFPVIWDAFRATAVLLFLETWGIVLNGVVATAVVYKTGIAPLLALTINYLSSAGVLLAFFAFIYLFFVRPEDPTP